MRPGGLAPRIPGLLALCLAALSGCVRNGGRADLPRDTVETPRSAAVLAPYLSERPPRRTGRDAAGGPLLPAPPGPGAKLPGETATPWRDAPRTLPFPPEPKATKAAPRPVETTPVHVPTVRGDVLNPGDELAVTVERHPEFSGEWRVRADGELSIPETGAFGVGGFTGRGFAARVGRVAGLKPAEAGVKIAEQLKAFLKQPPRVTVKVLGSREG